MSLDEFQRYWLESHAPLVRSLREALPEMKRYVQCHTIPGPATDLVRAGRGAGEPFDGVTEVWLDELPSGDEPTTEAAAEAGMRLLQERVSRSSTWRARACSSLSSTRSSEPRWRLEDRVAVGTGAGTGVHEAIARSLLRRQVVGGRRRPRTGVGCVAMGLLAGPPQEPRKRTSLHHRHKDMGGTMMWTGAWRRPHSYGPDAGAEAQHVHQALGLIDVSTLGKILVSGPDAGAFLDRVYPNRFSDLKVGRTRYGVLTGDAGRIMDDGVVARVDESTFYVSATSTGADGVYQWFTWWNAVWFMDVQFANLTGALAAVNVAGPNARAAMQRVSDDDFSADGFAYLDAKHVTVAGVPTLALRIGFVGELGYELHFPSPLAEHVWDSIFAKAADLDPKPFGLEPQRILRLEKGHVIVGQDTDSESNLHEAAMPWLVKNDKEFDWVGKWATQQVADRGLKWMLVGFESPSGAIPVEGGQVVVAGKSAGRVTSVRKSAELGKVIGLAIVPNELAVDGGRFDVQVQGRSVPMTVHLGPFYDPAGERVKS